MSSQPTVHTCSITAFHYGQIIVKQDKSPIRLQRGSFYVHLEVEKSTTGSLISFTIKVSRSRDASADGSKLVALDLGFYATLPKANGSPALRVHRKEKIILISHRDLAELATAQGYCRLMLMFDSATDARNFESRLSPVCEVVAPNLPESAFGSTVISSEHSPQPPKTQQPGAFPPGFSQFEHLQTYSQLPDSLLRHDQHVAFNQRTGTGLSGGNSFPTPRAAKQGLARLPGSGIQERQPNCALPTQTPINDAPLPSVYGMSPAETQTLVARIVREDGFVDFMDKLKNIGTANIA